MEKQTGPRRRVLTFRVKRDVYYQFTFNFLLQVFSWLNLFIAILLYLPSIVLRRDA